MAATNFKAWIAGLAAKVGLTGAETLYLLDGDTSKSATPQDIADLAAAWAVQRAGVSGGQTIIGGTDAADALILQGTSGNGVGSPTAFAIKVGNDGDLVPVNIDGDGVIRFGLGSNYLQIGTDGTLTLAGSATYWDDLTFPLTQGKRGNTGKPDYDYTNVGYLFPQNNTGEIIYLSVQMPHRWKEGSTLYPHVHFHQSANQNPVFKMDYRWTNIGGTVSGSWTTLTMSTLVAAYSSGTISQIVGTGGVGISGAGKTISSELQIKLYRDDNVYMGDVLATMFDIHTECDALGSSQEYIK